MKPKIAYISPDCFFDVDFPILKELNKQYDISWFPIIPEKNSRFSLKEIKEYAELNKINYSLHIRKGRRRSVKQLFFTIKLIKSIKKEKPDIYYFEYLSDPYITLLSYMFIPSRKVIYAIHDVESHTSFNSIFLDFLKKINFRHYKWFHVFSKSQKKIFDSRYPKKTSFYAPLALKDFGNTKISKPLRGITKFLFFGNIVEYKGLDILIQAFESLIKEGVSNIQLTIAGKGTYWEYCEKLIKNKAFYNLKIEFIPNYDIPDLFKSHHYLVLPYFDTTQSGPLLIAMNYDLPVIASSLDGFKEYITHRKNGFLFDNKNIYSLINEIKYCSNLSMQEYNTIISNAKEIREDYNIASIIDKYNKMFKHVLTN